MKFYTKYFNGDTIFSKSGTGIFPVYTTKILENGSMSVVPSMIKNKKGELVPETDDVYSKIQANADSVDINLIIKKWVCTSNE